MRRGAERTQLAPVVGVAAAGSPTTSSTRRRRRAERPAVVPYVLGRCEHEQAAAHFRSRSGSAHRIAPGTTPDHEWAVEDAKRRVAANVAAKRSRSCRTRCDRKRPAVEVEALVDDCRGGMAPRRPLHEPRRRSSSVGVDFQLTRKPLIPAAFAQRTCCRMTACHRSSSARAAGGRASRDSTTTG